MRTGRLPTIAIPLAAACILAGCAQPGPLAQRQTKLGSLKTSVGQLEHDNEQLENELAEQKAENRRLEDRLVQEKNNSDELATRLDDAKNLIRGQGGDAEVLSGATSPADSSTTNVGRKAKPGHKPPFAQIRGQIDELPAEEPDDRSAEEGPRSHRDDLGARVRPKDHRWLPVARGVVDETSSRH